MLTQKTSFNLKLANLFFINQKGALHHITSPGSDPDSIVTVSPFHDSNFINLSPDDNGTTETCCMNY